MPAFAPERLRVGITGHRLDQLPQGAHAALQARIGETLARITESARDAGHGYARLALVSALAEGADRFAAHAAFGLGWRLIAPLPFAPARYEQDFADAASIAEFRALLARADQRMICDVAPDADPAAPYAAVGRLIADLSKVLLAVWNGAPPKGPGGTAEVCALALDAGAPVIWIDPDGAHVRLIAPARLPNARSFRFRLRTALETRFPLEARPADMRVAA